jgi:hypothetical protein
MTGAGGIGGGIAVDGGEEIGTFSAFSNRSTIFKMSRLTHTKASKFTPTLCRILWCWEGRETEK